MEYNENAWETDRIQDVFERNAKSQETKFENVWNLIKDKEYYVRLSLYDETMKQIRITPNAKFNVFFEIFSIIPNHSSNSLKLIELCSKLLKKEIMNIELSQLS